MLHPRAPRPHAPALLAAFTLAALAGSASAQFDVYRLGIPDLDQRRSGLVGNGGMHCVPTSCMNLYAYAANHGAPLATNPFPGPRPWGSPANYNVETQLISSLGALMGTTAANGTSGSGEQNGLNLYNAVFAFGEFTSDVYWASGSSAPGPFDLSFNMALGGLVAVCYGFYDQNPNTGVWTRGGGHCMSLVAIQNTLSSSPFILVRDPANDEGNVPSRLTAQSPFTTDKYTLQAVTGNFRYASQNGSDHRTQYRLVEKGAGRFLDTVTVIWPQVGITPVSFGGVPSIKFHIPYALINEPQELDRIVPVGHGVSAIIDTAIGLNKAHVFFTGQTGRTGGGLYRHNRVTDVVELIAPLASPGKLVVGRSGEIFACDGSVMKAVTFDDAGAPMVRSFNLPIPPDGVFYDDAADELHIISTSQDRLARLGTDGAVRANLRFPAGLNFTGDGSVLPAPDGVSYWIAHQGDGLVRVVRPAAGAAVLTLSSTIELPAVQSIRSMQFDDRGHFFACDGSVVHEFHQDPASGRWVPTPGSMWTNLPAGPSFRLGRSRTNYQPAIMDSSAVNILNGEPGNGGSIPDCAIDFNLDGNIDPDDLSDFIAAFFAAPGQRFPDRRCDVDQNGVIDPDDLADFIGNFFAGAC